MKLRIKSQEGRRLEMEVGGEGHTLLNLLQSSLLKLGNVRMTGYSKPHPLMDRSTIYVTLKRGQTFNREFLRATKGAKDELERFLKQFEAQLPKDD
ncbi:MAG: RpoL/Rpb11 RNA polymerase subunit family protein [Candidatus Bathyarchaeota archaeon]|jgi:DNA-directed RNA polymerase subunit L